MRTDTALPLGAAERTTLSDDIVEKLVAYIAERRILPGEMLPSEKQLCEALGVSRLPLREALSRLKALGVISVRQGKGATVLPVNAANLFRQLSPIMRSQAGTHLRQMMEARLALEPAIAGLAAERRDEETLRLLQQCLAGMAESLEDRAAFIRPDVDFHQALARATGNPVLVTLGSTIHDAYFATQWGYPDKVEARRRSLHHHQRIYEAVRAGDAAAAAAAMAAHLNDVTAALST